MLTVLNAFQTSDLLLARHAIGYKVLSVHESEGDEAEPRVVSMQIF